VREPCVRRRVLRYRRAGGGLRLALRPAEQEPVQRRAGGDRGRRPPHDDLAHRAGERDVEQPQLLAGVLGVGDLLARGVAGAVLAADVEDAAAVRVVQQQRRLLRVLRAVPAVRHVDDRELQPLARVHGDDLDGGGVGLQAPAALGQAAAVGVLDALPEPGAERAQPERLLDGGPVEHLGQVAQVGEPALPCLLGQQPALQARLRGQPLEGRCQACLLEPRRGLAHQRR
jgi:hypothetical protein